MCVCVAKLFLNKHPAQTQVTLKKHPVFPTINSNVNLKRNDPIGNKKRHPASHFCVNGEFILGGGNLLILHSTHEH